MENKFDFQFLNENYNKSENEEINYFNLNEFFNLNNGEIYQNFSKFKYDRKVK